MKTDIIFLKLVDNSSMKKEAAIQDLRSYLSAIVEPGIICGLKTGTEIEDMGYDEILFMRQISRNIVPLTVKIGGPEARQDIRSCLKMGIDCILAPMVESVYALNNFVSTVLEISEEEEYVLPELAMNLESATAYRNLDDMIASRSFEQLSHVTIGRGDLSKSMHLSVDDEVVITITARAIRKLKNSGKKTSVGGGLLPQSAMMLAAAINSHKFNTRHVVVANSKEYRKNPSMHVYKALQFELELYAAMADAFPERKEFYLKRSTVVRDRMGGLQLLTKKNI